MKVRCCGCGDIGEFSDGLSDAEVWNYGGFFIWGHSEDGPALATCDKCSSSMYGDDGRRKENVIPQTKETQTVVDGAFEFNF